MLTFLLLHWRIVALAGVLAFAGLQTYRLQGAHGHIDLMEEQERSRLAAEQKQKLQDLKNKERTDAQYTLDLAAARRAGVRNGTKRVYVTIPASPPASRDPGTVCFDAGQLDAELTAWAGRVAGRLEGVARQAEEVAAAYRACRAWALD